MLNKKLYKIKSCNKEYKKKLISINKTRERLNVINYIQEVLNDLADFEFDSIIFGNSIYDMFGQLVTSKQDLQYSEWVTDANYQDYYMFDRINWEEYNNE